MTDATPPINPPRTPIIHTQPGSSTLCLCHRSGVGVEGVFGGCAVPAVIINSGSTGHRVGAVHFKVPLWLSSLNQNVDHTG